MKLNEIEKEWGVLFNDDPEMELSDWLRKNKLTSLANALDALDNVASIPDPRDAMLLPVVDLINKIKKGGR